MFSSPGSIAFEIGRFSIRWYGLLIATAVLLGTSLAHREAVRRQIDPEPLLNAIVLAVISGLVGARLYYVLFNWGYYGHNLSKIIAVWEGGLAIHGGILGGGLAVLLYARHYRLPAWTYCDVIVPFLALGQAIGRWGNFFNQEAFGTPTTLPWRLYIPPEYRPLHLKGYEYFHPTFLYESLWDLFVFAALFWVLRTRMEKRSGALTLAYLGLYSIGRFFVESFRIDSLWLGPVRAAQVISLLFVGASALGLVLLHRRR